ncbi:hypothetical protein FACS1894145_7000 [Bacteroidia bacterium]|nr:hypothetical protein FACS1894145_7000 [Bacteroidia bacterium]
MRTPITYYGGKQRIAPKIISMIPKHKIYCESFFGGGAVFFAKPKSGIEVINDHDNQLINFYLCVQNRFDELRNFRDALRVIQDRDTPETFFYLDPPYPGCNQQHYSGYTEENLEELLSLLMTIKGKFILSNYWCDILRKYVDQQKWHYKEIKVDLRISNLGRGAARKKITQYRTEVLVYNYQLNKNLFNE